MGTAARMCILPHMSQHIIQLRTDLLIAVLLSH